MAALTTEHPRKRVSLGRRILRAWQLYLMLLLPLAWVIIFCYWPLYGIQIAFRDYSPVHGITGSLWVGFDHFVRFLTSYQFPELLRNTVGLHLYELLIGFPAPIILALALNALRQKYFSRYVQLVAYAPNFLSVVVVVGIMVMMLSPSTGVVNQLFGAMGLPRVDFMGQSEWFQSLYVFSGVWQSAGFAAIIYLAALSSVPPELHEAARMDGASRLRRIWHIDLPSIMPIAVIMLILNIGSILNVGFEKVLLMQNPLNLGVSQVINTYVYQVGLHSDVPQYSYATAIGVFQSVVGVILLLLANWAARRIAKSGLF
ncbi:ABC transporter permease [Psychromicrobium xiongbiense]|uniref:ABC transporter permease n=1 Tax=Psychromicrobium xiongbiense TaxID=3051184 RepID=UPI002556361D|nr:ABC transporter permease subunit [Psychromicrobium sp. YIM S02556]